MMSNFGTSHDFKQKPKEQRLAWLDILRALAVLLVLWSHLVGEIVDWYQIKWLPGDLLNKYFFDALGLFQHGGALGVFLFFLISGYIITKVAQRETPQVFVIKRILRIYPLLAVATLLAFVLIILDLNPYPEKEINARLIIENISLLNFLQVPSVRLIEASWTLEVEMLFYLLVLIFLPIIKHRKGGYLFPFTGLLVCPLIFLLSKKIGPSFFVFSHSFLYIPMLIIGSLTYYLETNKIRFWFYITSCFFAWIIFLQGVENFYPNYMQVGQSYSISAFLAIAIFTFSWIYRAALKTNQIISLIALTSYSTYLLHRPVGFPILHFLLPNIGYSASLLVSLIVIASLVSISYLFIEKPFQQLARSFTTKYAKIS